MEAGDEAGPSLSRPGRRLSVDRLARQFSNSIPILYAVQSENQSAGPTYTFDLPAGIYIIRAEIAHDQKTVKLRVQ